MANPFASVSNGIGSVISSVSSVASSIGTSADIVNDYVKHQQSKLRKDYALDLVRYDTRAAIKAAKIETEALMEAQEFRSKSDDHARLYDTTLASIQQDLARLNAEAASAKPNA